MLTQKMTKELCQLAQGYNVEETKKQLNESLTLFAQTMETLSKVDPKTGLSGETPGMALELIGHSKSTFASVEPILGAAASGTSSTPDE